MCPALAPKNIGSLAARGWAAGGGVGRVTSPEKTALKVDKLEEKDTQAGIGNTKSLNEIEVKNDGI